MAGRANPFKSYLMGGYECSTHRTRSGRRLDIIAATRHDEFAVKDYERAQGIGMLTVRDGVRWHLIEREPFHYDFASLEKQIAAARQTGIQVIWDYFHYGYPDDLDILSEHFIERFAAFTRAVTEFIVSELGPEFIFCPVNEISFFSWAAGRAAIFHPLLKTRAPSIKRQMVKCVIASVNAALGVCHAARWVLTEPAVHVATRPGCSKQGAARYRVSQFQALDMIAGRVEPELGGRPEFIDLIGLNYYIHNQWVYPSRVPLPLSSINYRPPHKIFAEFYARYGKPIFIAETGIEEDRRSEWFQFIAGEAEQTINDGVPLLGLCLYPVVNHPGWDDDRHCENGLWDYANDEGERIIYEPLADVIQQCTFPVNALTR